MRPVSRSGVLADEGGTFRLSRTIQPWNVVLVAQP
jgi:hypothetical protein